MSATELKALLLKLEMFEQTHFFQTTGIEELEPQFLYLKPILLSELVKIVSHFQLSKFYPVLFNVYV